ncbi:MAG: glycerol-3-phosphate dehydrogenase/oxidase [Myxococcales bacterium]|nr:glycerol-3-phosphate dehydrogenase/oxidase [Myxococcales bacterium]MCB9521053.1 glycerol-3-phosphate dehydrogenase/oxidase [Myxococcales bacterium]MCB9532463.1 glycerol-3-phosphate dehydrogenase/oxidase [Myxococcales bacterium]
MTLGARDNPYDLVVIGGGINGAAIARDATLRGLRVALFEMRDFSTGATWASSGMIHGGLRYLSKDPEVTRLACLDSGFIQKIAPHLIFRIPFIMPWLAEGGLTAKVVFELAEVYFDAYDRYQPLKRGKQHCRLTPAETRAVEPGIRGDVLGALTMDEWGIDAQRLTVVNAVDAAERGAAMHTYWRVERLLRESNGTVCGIHAVDRLSGERRDVFAKVVFNACGPWAARFAAANGIESVRIRPGKGVHLVFAGRVTNYAVIFTAIDGRQVFICPHQNVTLLGTTDDDYYGDLEQMPILEDEVQYLLEAGERMFPGIARHPLIGTTVGARPTLYEYGPNEDELSRSHRVFDHARDGASGCFSMAGGKLASYRVMAEEATDLVCAHLGHAAPCTTATTALPGGDEHDTTVEAFASVGVDAVTATRILYRHGSRAEQIRQLMRDEPRTRAVVDPLEPVTEAELRHCIRTEHVRTLDDLKRRCRLGLGADGGARAAGRAAQILCEELGLSDADAAPQARAFLQARWEDRRGVVREGGLAREAVSQASQLLAARLDVGRPAIGRPGAGGVS